MRRGHQWIVAGGRRTFHFQHVLSSLEAWIDGLWASLVDRMAFHPMRRAVRSVHGGDAGAFHA
jgi:hypothetical protein